MSFDLREHPCDELLTRIEKTLHTTLDPTTEVRKRRSIGFRTDRKTWVRIEIRSLDRIDGQAWGTEAAALLKGVSKPAWFQGFSWLDADLGVMWRADETELIADPPIKPGGILTTEPELPASWWATFNRSLDALASHSTTRLAVPQLRITETIERVFPGQVDTTVDEWTVAHADLAWANLTAPNCYFLDWEDWGRAPRGYDAASLWRESLALPALAERVCRERQADLDSRSGKLAQLCACAVIIRAGAGYAGPLWEPVRTAAEQLLSALRA